MSNHADLVLAAAASAEASSALVASWRRSVTHGLHPDRTLKPEPDMEALRTASERHALMIAIAIPHIQELHLALSGIDATIMLADPTGLILLQRNARTYEQSLHDKVGMRLAEQDVGTGPVGTVLVEERAIMFGAGQCFSLKVANLRSMGAPIFGRDGHVTGVLTCGYTDQTGELRSSFNELLFMTLSQYSRRISCELFAKSFPQARLLKAPGSEHASFALIAVGPDDLVLGATRCARRLLGLSDARLRTNLTVQELFGASEARDLAAVEAKLIAQTMTRYGNNRTAVAKALGISRSTLYRKLDGPRIARIRNTRTGSRS